MPGGSGEQAGEAGEGGAVRYAGAQQVPTQARRGRRCRGRAAQRRSPAAGALVVGLVHGGQPVEEGEALRHSSRAAPRHSDGLTSRHGSSPAGWSSPAGGTAAGSVIRRRPRARRCRPRACGRGGDARSGVAAAGTVAAPRSGGRSSVGRARAPPGAGPPWSVSGPPSGSLWSPAGDGREEGGLGVERPDRRPTGAAGGEARDGHGLGTRDSGSGWATGPPATRAAARGPARPDAGRGRRHARDRPGGHEARWTSPADATRPPAYRAWICRPESDSPAIFSCSRTIPWSRASGRGGQPGT